MHTSREGLYQSCIKIGEISNFGFLPIFFFFFFSFSLTLDHMGEKTSSDILSESIHSRDLLPKIQVYCWSRNVLYQSCIEHAAYFLVPRGRLIRWVECLYDIHKFCRYIRIFAVAFANAYTTYQSISPSN